VPAHRAQTAIVQLCSETLDFNYSAHLWLPNIPHFRT